MPVPRPALLWHSYSISWPVPLDFDYLQFLASCLRSGAGYSSGLALMLRTSIRRVDKEAASRVCHVRCYGAKGPVRNLRLPGSREALNKWHNRHDACLRADRGVPTQTDWPSFKSAQQRAARRQASPKRLIQWNTGGVQKARQRHRAARQGNQPSRRHAAPVASLLNAMTIAPLVQSLPRQGRCIAFPDQPQRSANR